MIVYKDILTGDEVISDSYKIAPVIHDGEEVPGLFEVSPALCQKLSARDDEV